MLCTCISQGVRCRIIIHVQLPNDDVLLHTIRLMAVM